MTVHYVETREAKRFCLKRIRAQKMCGLENDMAVCDKDELKIKKKRIVEG